MPRGRRTSYTRDNSGRFASSPGGGAPKRSTPATRRAATRAGNRLNRDNSGRITGIGRDGATVRGGRLKTGKGNRRATQIASMRPAGLRSGTIAKGGRGVRGSVARSLAAAKQQPQGPSKKPVNKAQRAYLAARSVARSRGGDLRGADVGTRRMASSAAAVVKGMERRRSAAVPKAPADSPRARQQQRQAARAQRAIRNQRAAMAREADGPGSKASRSATVAKRAQQIYAGKVDPRAKTKSRLTRTSNPEALRKRIAKIKDNTARAAAKAAAKAAKAAAKPAKKESKSNISDAKAGRIIARLDANRPGLRKATGSDRRNRNLLQTYDRASKFILAASARESKRSGGQSRMDLAESVRRAVRNAKAKAKPKPRPAKPTTPKRTRSARPAGTVAKPRGMKPGVLAARRGVKAAKAPAIQTTGRTRAQAAAAQRSRNKRLADYAEFSISLNPRVSRNSRLTEEGRYAESFGRPVIARRKYSQPNIFGGTDRVAGSNRARLVGTRERGQIGVIPLAARALPIKGRGKQRPRPYGSR